MRESPEIIARLARTYRLFAVPDGTLASRDPVSLRAYATHLATLTVLDLGRVPKAESGASLLIRAHTHDLARRLDLPLAP